MFLGQPLLYRLKILRILNMDVEAWINNHYILGGTVVFAVSVLSTVIWYLITANAKAHKAEEVAKWELVWWLFLLFPLLSLFLAIGFFKGSDDALGPLTIFLCLTYYYYFGCQLQPVPWGLKFVPPGSIKLRSFFGE
ncbi:hypothetical protein CYANOKiyG1_79100 [Okeania sp. KiyG1]|nr:hypothetical protein CYANOKiyG1_79100 [Okeania sp. KiyG1]